MKNVRLNAMQDRQRRRHGLFEQTHLLNACTDCSFRGRSVHSSDRRLELTFDKQRACPKLRRHLSLIGAVLVTMLTADGAIAAPEAISWGGGSCGALTGGLALPCSGPNYEAFASITCFLGRNTMHPLVAATVVEAYSVVGSRHRGRQWQYGDLGLKQGGELWPHKTHQSGVSADFFFPVIDAAGAPAQIPISVLNDFGYGVDFDAQGRFEALRIDWKAMVDHWLALEAAGKGRGVAIRRIILAPSLQKTLLKKETRAAAFVKRFNKRRAWVVHDEHYHIDFSIPAHLRKPLSCR